MKKKTEEYVNLAQRSPLFAGFSRDEVRHIIATFGGEILSFPAGTTVAATGETSPEPPSILLLLSGQVQLIRYGLHGEQCMIDYTMPGGVLGVPQALGGERSYHNAMLAGTDCTLLRLAVTKEARLSDSWQRLEHNLFQITIQKNIRLMKKVDILSGRSVREKILTYLRYESEIHDSAEFDIPLNRQEFADYIYVDRTTLSSELGKMRQDGLIECRRNHFILL